MNYNGCGFDETKDDIKKSSYTRSFTKEVFL